MVRIRHGSLALALALAFVGCKKDDKKSDPAGGDKTAEKAAGDKAAGGAATGAVASSEDLSLLPVESELVLGINWQQVQGSALWKQFVEPKMMTGENAKNLSDFKAKCGFDPMTAVKTISLGLKNLSSNSPDGVVVVHGVDKAKTLACLDTMKPEMEAKGTEYTRDGDVALFKDKKGTAMGLTFTNDSTAVAVIGAQANLAGVKQVATGGSKLKDSDAFRDMYSKVRTGDSLWGLMNGNSPVFDKMGNMGIKAKAVFGSLNVTDGLSLDLRIRAADAAGAQQLASMSKQQLGQASKMFDQSDVVADGNDVKYTMVMSAAKLQNMIQQFGGMLGGLGGQ
jgi:hypothetical protein